MSRQPFGNIGNSNHRTDSRRDRNRNIPGKKGGNESINMSNQQFVAVVPNHQSHRSVDRSNYNTAIHYQQNPPMIYEQPSYYSALQQYNQGIQHQYLQCSQVSQQQQQQQQQYYQVTQQEYLNPCFQYQNVYSLHAPMEGNNNHHYYHHQHQPQFQQNQQYYQQYNQQYNQQQRPAEESLDREVRNFIEQQTKHNREQTKHNREQRPAEESLDRGVRNFMDQQLEHNREQLKHNREQLKHNGEQKEHNMEMSIGVTSINEKLSSLIKVTPEALVNISVKTVHLVATPASINYAIAHGSPNTFTFMLGPNGEKLAVSASHCVKTIPIGLKTFVSVPNLLKDIVIGVGLRKGYDFIKSEFDSARDMAFYVLKEFPEGVEIVTEWPVTDTANDLSFLESVGGKSLSRNVFGTKCISTLDSNGESYYHFVYNSGDTGEGGNSGTCMFYLDEDTTKTFLVGVYLGNKKGHDVTRGRICPFVAFNLFQIHESAFCFTKKTTVLDEEVESTKFDRNIFHCKSDDTYGFFINRIF